jgi:hypothetical protein
MTTMVAPAELCFRAMGSDDHVLVNGPACLLQVARDRVEELERRWSRFRPDSEISRLNALAGAPMAVSPDTLGLVGRALEGARVTGGRYDPTVHGDVLRAGYDRTFEELGGAGTAGGGSPLGRGWVRVVVDAARSSVTLPAGSAWTRAGSARGTPPTWWPRSSGPPARPGCASTSAATCAPRAGRPGAGPGAGPGSSGSSIPCGRARRLRSPSPAGRSPPPAASGGPGGRPATAAIT